MLTGQGLHPAPACHCLYDSSLKPLLLQPQILIEQGSLRTTHCLLLAGSMARKLSAKDVAPLHDYSADLGQCCACKREGEAEARFCQALELLAGEEPVG